MVLLTGGEGALQFRHQAYAPKQNDIQNIGSCVWLLWKGNTGMGPLGEEQMVCSSPEKGICEVITSLLERLLCFYELAEC